MHHLGGATQPKLLRDLLQPVEHLKLTLTDFFSSDTHRDRDKGLSRKNPIGPMKDRRGELLVPNRLELAYWIPFLECSQRPRRKSHITSEVAEILQHLTSQESLFFSQSNHETVNLEVVCFSLEILRVGQPPVWRMVNHQGKLKYC